MSYNQSSLLNNQVGNQYANPYMQYQQNNRFNTAVPSGTAPTIQNMPNSQQPLSNNPQVNTQQGINGNQLNGQLNNNQNYAPNYNMMPSYSSYYQQGAFPIYGQSQMSRDEQEIKWVQGEAGAKAYLLAPGKRILLMDSESDTFYVKSTDQNGVPLPLRIFDYKERIVGQDGYQQTQQQVPNNADGNLTDSNNINTQVQTQNQIDINQFITREEFEDKIADLKSVIQKGGNKDESFIQSTGKQNGKPTKQFNKHAATVSTVQE